MNTKTIAANAVIAAVYAALTVAIAPISYGAVQFRLAEMLVFLAFYNKKYIPGLILGCFIANCFSPMWQYDIFFGTAATAIALFGIHYGKYLFRSEIPGLALAAVTGALVNGLIVGLELHLAYEIPYIINACWVALGELAVLSVGAVVFKSLSLNKQVKRILNGSMFEDTVKAKAAG